MFMSKNKKNLVVYGLIFCLLTINVYGCGKDVVPQNTNLSSYSLSVDDDIDTGIIAEIITEEIRTEAESLESEVPAPVEISSDWKDYVGDLDTFVYGLLEAEYRTKYDVFEACIELDDGSEIYGMGYTDYNGIFESDDKIYFPAGFIGLIGENPIPTDEADNGLEIIDLNSEDAYGFIYAYSSEPYTEHCVIWNHYLKYGVDEGGTITYEASEYVKEECDEDLGALYSYDEKKYLYDPNVGDYNYISGAALYESIDYSNLEAEVNRILEEQDIRFSDVDIQTSVLIAQEAVNSFLLSIQEETFMGYDVKELIKASEEIDPMECIRLTPDGMLIIDAKMPNYDSPSALVKWVTGISCGIVVIGCVATDIFCPPLNPLSGAISSSAVEVFLEVVVNNQNIKNINWAKVGVAAVSGALLAWASPMLAAKSAGGVVNILGTKLRVS